jgi:hypothetical protein
MKVLLIGVLTLISISAGAQNLGSSHISEKECLSLYGVSCEELVSGERRKTKTQTSLSKEDLELLSHDLMGLSLEELKNQSRNKLNSISKNKHDQCYEVFSVDCRMMMKIIRDCKSKRNKP